MARGHANDEGGAARYRSVRPLGRGGMGQVSLVEDAERGQQVALKRLLSPTPDALLRMKKEFRVIERLHHPALVRLHELGEDGEGLYFTMEAVEGVDLLSYCRNLTGEQFGTDGTDPTSPSGDERAPPARSGMLTRESAPTLDAGSAPPATGTTQVGDEPVLGELSLPRLAHVLPQLLEALAFLHAHGIVHRDLKPANVLVRRDGGLKLLDFGILAELGGVGEQGVAGTVGYMAPEQVRQEPPAPSNDLYALGVVLFEIASGLVPFRGPPMNVMFRTASEEAPPLDGYVADAPTALVEACAALLRKEPGERPSLAQLADTLLPAIGARAPVFEAPRVVSTDLVGRDRERELLDAAFTRARAGTFAAAVVRGATGAGKSALVAAAVEEVERAGGLVLRGRGRARDRVPYNAVDAAVDALAVHLGSRRRGRLSDQVRRAASVAGTVFPVLTRVLGSEILVTAPHGRRAAFDALVDLIAHTATAAGPTALWIDDLQWADEDSVALLDSVVRAGPESVVLVATLRDDVGRSPGGDWAAELEGAVDVELGSLADEALAEILRRRASEIGEPPSDEVVRAAVARCEGRPFLAEVVGRALGRGSSAAHSGSDALAAIVADAGEGAHPVMAALLAADGWTRADTLGQVTGSVLGEVLDSLDDLEQRGLVRRAGSSGPAGLVDFFHDSVRQRAASAVAAEGLRHAHSRFADLLADDPGAPVHRRVRHLHEAGRVQEAARAAPAAATAAAEQRAFGLAAEMYGVALEADDGDREALLAGRADALDKAARYAEAADVWRELAGERTGDARVEAMLGEASSLLAARRIAEGHERLGEALTESGERGATTGGLRGVWAALRFLRGPGESPPVRPVADPVLALRRAERDVRVGWMLGYFDPLAGLRFLLRGMDRFGRLGAREERAWACYLLAMLAYFGDARPGPVKHALAFERAANEALEGRDPEAPLVRALPVFLEGYRGMRHGRFRESVAAMDAALRTMEEAQLDGTFEHGLGLNVMANVVGLTQRLADFRAACERVRHFEDEVSDSAFGCHASFNWATLHILEGDIEAAEAELASTADVWPREPANIQVMLIDLFACMPLMARGDVERTWRGLREVLRRHRRFRPLSTGYGPALAAAHAVAEARALRAGDREASARRIRRLSATARASIPLQSQSAWRAMAYLEDAQGRPEAALEWLRAAEAKALELDTPLELAIVRYQLGRRLGGDEGAQLRARARAAIDAQGATPTLLDEDPGDV